MSEWISEILEVTCKACESEEVISSEELLSFVNELNKRLRQEGVPEMGFCVGSLEVKALYPSLLIEACAKIAHNKIIISPVSIPDMDTKWAAI